MVEDFNHTAARDILASLPDSTAAIARSFRSMHGLPRSPPPCSKQRFAAATPDAGQWTAG